MVKVESIFEVTIVAVFFVLRVEGIQTGYCN